MAGGSINFGPTYNSTTYVRVAYEGLLNGTKAINGTLVTQAQTDATKGQLSGKFACIMSDGSVGLADGTTNTTSNQPIGLFREDLKDMINASGKATFYFRGGEYFVYAGGNSGNEAARIDATGLAVGDELAVGTDGRARKYVAGDATAGRKKVGVVTSIGPYTNGNMYANAGDAANGGTFVGFIMYV